MGRPRPSTAAPTPAAASCGSRRRGAAVVGGTFANGTTAAAADSNVTVRGGAFFGFAGPVLRAREAAPSSSSAGPTTARRPTASPSRARRRRGRRRRHLPLRVAGGRRRARQRQRRRRRVRRVSTGRRPLVRRARGRRGGAFAVGGFAGPLARTYASAGAYAAAAACLAEATCYEITATGAAAGWTFAGRDYAGDGVVPFSLGADLCADGAPAASNATCPRSSRSGGDAGRDLDLLLAYSVVVLAIIGAVALSVTGCYARRSRTTSRSRARSRPATRARSRAARPSPRPSSRPRRRTSRPSPRTALDLAAITLPAGDAVVVVAVAAGAPGARQTLSVNFVPPARHRAAAPAVAALRARQPRDAAAPASEQADLRALLTHVLVPFLGAYAACAANEKTLVILQRARAAKTRALLRCYERGAAAVAAEGVGPVAAVCAGLPAAPPPAQPSGDAPALYAAAARARDALGAVAKAVAADGRRGDGAGAQRPATVLRCVDGFAALAAAPWSSVVCLELQLDGVVAELAVAHAALDAVDPCVEINQ
ncbi:hypothetical protein JL722_2636 [Aureococcus anophagefferens]|nr:hypothetical protein JL722_2636 [Aureococcus anophagefferens]